MLEFDFSGKTVTPGQVFGVVEYSGTGTNTGNCRFRNLTLNNGDGETKIEEGSKASQLTFTVGENTVVLCPFLQNANSNASLVMKTYYVNNVDKESLTLTYARAYVGGTSGTEMTLKRVGIYTLGEILELYPSLKSTNFQINENYRLLNDASTLGINNSKTNNGTDNGLIETKNAAITTIAGCKLFCKAVDFAKIPDNYRYFWFRFLQPEDATTEDLFAELNDNAVLMLSFGTGSNAHALAKLPTMHNKLIDFDRNMYNYTFVDGVAPGSAEKVDVKGSQSNNWGTYSRSLKAGYNSCAMPFKKMTNASDIPSGITFYKVGSYADGKVTFTKMSDSDLTGNNAFTTGTDWTPIIIKAETAGVYTFVGRDAITDWSGITYKEKKVGGSGETNAIYFVGSFVNESPTASGKAYDGVPCYGIKGDGSSLVKMTTSATTTYYRAFLADKRSAGAPAFSLSFDNLDGTTDIVSLRDVHGLEVEDGMVYNLQGIRMSGDQLPRGIYVKNGKKFVVK